MLRVAEQFHKTDTGRQGELLRLMFVCAGIVALD